MKAHGSQKRASGDPYFSHPLEVADILTEHEARHAPRSSPALLHDTVEDTDATLERDRGAVRQGDRAAWSTASPSCRASSCSPTSTKQAENFRKLVLAMSEDIRVLLVKLADRLHNMQTLHYIKDPEKRKRIARETMEIYAPLAERIGMQQIKDELEDLAFARAQSRGARQSIVARLELPARAGRRPRRRASSPSCSRSLKDGGRRRPQVSGREKTPYSIWRKMQRKNVALRAALRHHGLPRRRRRRGRLLPGARRPPQPLSDGARPLQGLHLDAEAERLPLAPHRRHRAGAAAHRGPDPHPRDARDRRARRRRALAATSRARAAVEGTAVSLAARAAGHPRARGRARGIPRAHQARDVPGPGVLLHARRAI